MPGRGPRRRLRPRVPRNHAGVNPGPTLYEQLGFTYLTQSLGDSGHFGCQLWMIRAV
ncbi:MAG: hypothetical protein WKG07_32815 [Hymenobacter sp.]